MQTHLMGRIWNHLYVNASNVVTPGFIYKTYKKYLSNLLGIVTKKPYLDRVVRAGRMPHPKNTKHLIT